MDFIVDFVHWGISIALAFVHGGIDMLGYWGVALMMAIESCNIPLPSELIMPYAGFMAQQGKMNIHLAAFAGAFGCVLGSAPSYWLGYYGGRPFVAKYGRWLLLSIHELDKAEKWTLKYGNWTFFICRMLPVLRTFISLPAGVLKTKFWPFMGLTFLGSWVWCYGLVYVGVIFGENLEEFRHYWHKFDYAIVAIILGLGIWYVWHHAKNFMEPTEEVQLDPTLDVESKPSK